MPKTDESTKFRLIKACEAAKLEEKPNISKIAREYDVPRRTLYNHVKKDATTKSSKKRIRRTLDDTQEEVLVNWIVKMNDLNMPPTPKVIEKWANLLLASGGTLNKPVGKMWVYRFINRLPANLQLDPMYQRTKESKRIQTKDVGLLANWYNQLKKLLEGVPGRLVYNFDECGFRPGEGKNQKVVGRKDLKRSFPDPAETERGENITVLECIAADGWHMDPLFIFKSNGSFIECWFDDTEDITPNTMVGTPSNDWISDILAVQWLDQFIKATGTSSRMKKGEKRILIFDGHDSYLTLEFLQKCEDHDILPFSFLPHSTHLCQPLDGKPFLSYKQHLQSLNNDVSYRAGKPIGKAEFLRMIEPVRLKAFKQRIIRESFKERGIYPVDDSKILSKLSSGGWDDIPDPIASDLRSYDSRTPSPAFSSSSIGNSPPKSIEAFQKKHAKILKHTDIIPLELQQDIDSIFQDNRELIMKLTIANDTIRKLTAAQQTINCPKTKR